MHALERRRRPKMSEHFDRHATYLSHQSNHQFFYHATVANDFDVIFRMWLKPIMVVFRKTVKESLELPTTHRWSLQHESRGAIYSPTTRSSS